MTKLKLPPGVKVPGAIWSILFVVILSLVHRYLEDPFLVELLFIAAGLALPLLVDNNAQLKQALAVIKIVTRKDVIVVGDEFEKEREPGMRSSRPVTRERLEPVISEKIPEEPDPFITYLFG